MIPSPYPLKGDGVPEPPLTVQQMMQITEWVETLKRSFNLSQAMLVMKTRKKHAPCGDEDCDHYEKIILNLQLNKADLEELSDNIKGFLL